MNTVHMRTIKLGAVPKVSGVVERLVPGRLVYVAAGPKHEVFGVRPDRMLIREADGSYRHYRGEPFSELGLTVGTKVSVVGTRGSQASDVKLLLDGEPSGGKFSSFKNVIGGFQKK